MVNPSVLPGFIAVIMLFLIPPGPDMIYMLAVGLEGGRRAAIAAILGIGTGMSIYAGAVVFGVGAVIRSHPLALDIIKAAGAGYLLWLAYRSIRGVRDAGSDTHATAGGRWYARGLLVTLTNPKIVLFFLAVLPSFLGGADNTVAQLAMLGAVNVSTEVVLYGAIGTLAGTFHARFSRSLGARSRLSHVSAIAYVVLAAVIVGEIVFV